MGLGTVQRGRHSIQATLQVLPPFFPFLQQVHEGGEAICPIPGNFPPPKWATLLSTSCRAWIFCDKVSLATRTELRSSSIRAPTCTVRSQRTLLAKFAHPVPSRPPPTRSAAGAQIGARAAKVSPHQKLNDPHQVPGQICLADSQLAPLVHFPPATLFLVLPKYKSFEAEFNAIRVLFMKNRTTG